MSNAIVPVKEFALATLDQTELAEIISENLGGGSIDISSLDRVKVPSGGGLFWEVPTLEGPKPEKHVEGIIVYFRDNRAMWLKSQEESGGSAAPNCTGKLVPVDESGAKEWRGFGILHEGESPQARRCDQCPYNEFGSSDKGKGKKCKETRMLAILTPTSILPLILNVPPTSLQPIRKFLTRLTAQGVRYYGAVVRLGLREEKNEAGTKYGEITVELVERLAGAELARVKGYSEMIRPYLEKVDAEGTAAPETGSSFSEADMEIIDTEGVATE